MMMTQNVVSKKREKKIIAGLYGEFYMKMKSKWRSDWDFSGGDRTDSVKPEAYKKIPWISL